MGFFAAASASGEQRKTAKHSAQRAEAAPIAAAFLIEREESERGREGKRKVTTVDFRLCSAGCKAAHAEREG